MLGITGGKRAKDSLTKEHFLDWPRLGRSQLWHTAGASPRMGPVCHLLQHFPAGRSSQDKFLWPLTSQCTQTQCTPDKSVHTAPGFSDAYLSAVASPGSHGPRIHCEPSNDRAVTAKKVEILEDRVSRRWRGRKRGGEWAVSSKGTRPNECGTGVGRKTLSSPGVH